MWELLTWILFNLSSISSIVVLLLIIIMYLSYTLSCYHLRKEGYVFGFVSWSGCHIVCLSFRRITLESGEKIDTNVVCFGARNKGLHFRGHPNYDPDTRFGLRYNIDIE